MASFTEMWDSALFLIVGLISLMIAVLSVGPVIDWLSVWTATQPAGRIGYGPVQYVFGLFYGMICLMAGALFCQLFLTVIRRVDYEIGEDDW